MGSFKKITESTVLSPKMKIRRPTISVYYYDYYIIGNLILGLDKFELYPEGDDYLESHNIIFLLSKPDLIAKKFEYWEE